MGCLKATGWAQKKFGISRCKSSTIAHSRCAAALSCWHKVTHSVYMQQTISEVANSIIRLWGDNFCLQQ